MPGAQTVMLAAHLKKTDNVDLKTPILQYIRNVYSDRQADDAADDLQAVQQLRNDCVVAGQATQALIRDNLAKYYRSLAAVETRFPIGHDKATANVVFLWYDAFRTSKKTSQANIHFEKAAILFNMAASLSQSALKCDRNTTEGLTSACKQFQEAAGIFDVIITRESMKIDSPIPVDLSLECLTMMQKLMLAQAQESAFLKATIDAKSPNTLARLAKATSMMYEELTKLFTTPVMTSHFDKSWITHVQMKTSLYDVEALMASARAYQADVKVSCVIATLKEAFKRIQVTKTVAKGMNKDILEAITRIQDSINVTMGKAEKDNCTVYLERVPAFTDLPLISPAYLAKATTPANLDGSNDKLFSDLVPDSCTKSLSRYTDMVDSIMRDTLKKLAAATDNGRTRLAAAELPGLLDSLEQGSVAALPAGLLASLEEVERIGGVAHLKGVMAEIGQQRKNLEEEMETLVKTLETDAAADAECRNKYKEEWDLPPASTLSKTYWDRVSSYRSSLAKAAESDRGIISKLAENEKSFVSLTPSGAAAMMPRLEAPMVVTGPEDPAALVASMRRNLEAASLYSHERGVLEEALKELKQTDNILVRLMATSPAQYDALFAEEIKKYDKLLADINANCAQQDSVVSNLEKESKAFRAVFDVQGWRNACEAAAAGMKDQLQVFRDLLDHSSEGLRFYVGLQDVVQRCVAEANDWAFTRIVQRDELKESIERRRSNAESERLARALATTNLHSPPSASPVAYPPAHQPQVNTPPPQGYAPQHYPYGPPGTSAPPPAYHAPPPQGPPAPYPPQYGYQAPPPPQQYYQYPPQAPGYPPQGYAQGPPPPQQPYQQYPNYPYGDHPR